MSEEELVRLIEKLGNDLGDVIRLTKSIYDTIKQKYGINSNTLGIWILHTHNLQSAEESYTIFHEYFFNELKKEKEGHHVS